MKPLTAIYNKYRQFILYALIGVTGAALDFLIYWLLIRLGMLPTLATFISTSAGIVNNFIWNLLINFKTKNHIMLRFLSFYATGFLGIVLSMAIIWVTTAVLAWTPELAKLVSIPIVVIVQYFVNKTVTFAKRRPQGEEYD